MPRPITNGGWSPPGHHADTTKSRFDLKRGWLKPGDPVTDHGLQYVGTGEGAFDPSRADAAWHTVISPKGVAAPIDAHNYTPATGQVHAAGMQAPVNEDNVSLMPLDQYSFGSDMVGTGEDASLPPWDQAEDQGPWDTGLKTRSASGEQVPVYADAMGKLYIADAQGLMTPATGQGKYNWGTGNVEDAQGNPVVDGGRVEPSLAPQQGPPAPADNRGWPGQIADAVQQRIPGRQPIPLATGAPPAPAGNQTPLATGAPPTSLAAGVPLQAPPAVAQPAQPPADDTDPIADSLAPGTGKHPDFTGPDGVRYTWDEQLGHPVPVQGVGTRPANTPADFTGPDGVRYTRDAAGNVVPVAGVGTRPPAAASTGSWSDVAGSNGRYSKNSISGDVFDRVTNQIIVRGPGPHPGEQASGGQPGQGAVQPGGQQQMGGLPGHAAQMAKTYGLDQDVFLRQLAQESGWSTERTSPAGARGVAQFMPKTAEYAAHLIGVTPEQFWADPKLQITGAAALMSQYVTKYGNYQQALIAYNAGESVADRVDPSQPDLRIPSETQKYLDIILGGKQRGDAIPGLDNPTINPPGSAGAPGANPFAAAPKARRTQVVQGADGVDRLIDLDTGQEISTLPGGAAQDPRFKPQVVGNRVIQLNKDTGKYDVVYEGPRAHQIAQAGGHVLSIDPETNQTTSLYDEPGKVSYAGHSYIIPPDVRASVPEWDSATHSTHQRIYEPSAQPGYDLPAWVKRGPGGTGGSQGAVPSMTAAPWANNGVQPISQPLGGTGVEEPKPLPPLDQSPFQDIPDLGYGQGVGRGADARRPTPGIHDGDGTPDIPAWDLQTLPTKYPTPPSSDLPASDVEYRRRGYDISTDQIPQEVQDDVWRQSGGTRMGRGQSRWVGRGQEDPMPPKLRDDQMAVSVGQGLGYGQGEAPVPPIDPSQIVGGGNKFGQQVSMEGTHNGTDLQAYEGTPVIAPISGTVESVESDPEGLGLQVVIRGDDGSSHTLAHLLDASVSVGDQVQQGQVVARVGSTGKGSTGPHLDYRIQEANGAWRNPEPQLGQLGNLPEAPNTIQENGAVGQGQMDMSDPAMQDDAALPPVWTPPSRQVQQQPMMQVDDLQSSGVQTSLPQQTPGGLGPALQQSGLDQSMFDQQPQQRPQWQPQGGQGGMAGVSGSAMGSVGGLSGGGGAGSPLGASGGGGDVAQAALDDPDKWSLCGPVAAVIAVQKGWTVDQAKQFAQSQGLWDAGSGMHGLQSEVQLLKGMGVDADVGPAHPGLIDQALKQGVFPIISTPAHYFTIKGYDPTSGAYNVSTTGTALRGGSEWMTLDQIQQMGGGIDGAAYIRKPGAAGGPPAGAGQAAVGTGQGEWVGKGDAWGSDPSFNPFNDLTNLYNQTVASQSAGSPQASTQSAPTTNIVPDWYDQGQLENQRKQIDNQRQGIDNAAKAEAQRHQEAMAAAKTAAAQQKEQARHDKAMEQIQRSAQELTKQEMQLKAYSDAQNRNAQYRIQGTFGQQQQAKLLQSALTNPWLQNLSGMAPGYGKPGWSATSGGGVLQSLLNGWNPQATPDFSYQEQVPSGPKWLRKDLARGGGSQGAVHPQGAGAQGAGPGGAGASGGTSPMDAVMGNNPSTTAAWSQAGYGGYAPLGSAPPTPGYQQWRKMSPFERASWRTLEESAQPFPAAVQGAREQWAQQGVFDAPNSAALSARQMDPGQMMNQNTTAEMFGQRPEDYWGTQKKTWAKSAAPSITQVT